MTIKGCKFWLSGWIKEKGDGSKYMSLAFREVDEPAKSKPTAARSNFESPIDDTVPFAPEWRG